MLVPAKTISELNSDETIYVSGKVLRDGEPIAEARVYIHDQDTGDKYETVAKKDGLFLIKIPKPTEEKWVNLTLTAVAQHPGHSVGWIKLFRDYTKDITIELHQPMVIRGVVVNPSGDPLEDVVFLEEHCPGWTAAGS
jgi:hypothetical protein